LTELGSCPGANACLLGCFSDPARGVVDLRGGSAGETNSSPGRPFRRRLDGSPTLSTSTLPTARSSPRGLNRAHSIHGPMRSSTRTPSGFSTGTCEVGTATCWRAGQAPMPKSPAS